MAGPYAFRVPTESLDKSDSSSGGEVIEVVRVFRIGYPFEVAAVPSVTKALELSGSSVAWPALPYVF